MRRPPDALYGPQSAADGVLRTPVERLVEAPAIRLAIAAVPARVVPAPRSADRRASTVPGVVLLALPRLVLLEAVERDGEVFPRVRAEELARVAQVARLEEPPGGDGVLVVLVAGALPRGAAVALRGRLTSAVLMLSPQGQRSAGRGGPAPAPESATAPRGGV